MPFTLFHMGPGLVIKGLTQGAFSLMVFGWAQIIMDIQPLVVMLTGEGQLHGFSHTYVGASLLGAFAALTGKYLGEIGLFVLGLNRDWQVKIRWPVAVASALIGSYSHVLLDSLMHWDMAPLFPFYDANGLVGILSADAIYQLCVYSGLLGALLFFAVRALRKVRQSDERSQGRNEP